MLTQLATGYVSLKIFYHVYNLLAGCGGLFIDWSSPISLVGGNSSIDFPYAHTMSQVGTIYLTDIRLTIIDSRGDSRVRNSHYISAAAFD